MKPMFVKKDNHIFKSEYHPDVLENQAEATKALYHVKGDKVYAAGAHPDGPSPHAMFRIHGEKVFTTHHHPQHDPAQHVFEMGGVKPDASFIERVIKNA